MPRCSSKSTTEPTWTPSGGTPVADATLIVGTLAAGVTGPDNLRPDTSGDTIRLSLVILDDLEATLRSRRNASPEESYTARLLADSTLNQRKIMEEAFEVCLELQATPIDRGRTAEEVADLLYHVMVSLVGADVPLSDVFAVLEQRRRS